MGRLSGTTSGGRLTSSSSGGRVSNSTDLNSVQGLTNYANTVGLGQEAQDIVNPTPKLSFLQRLSAGLSAFNPAEAISTVRDSNVPPEQRNILNTGPLFLGTYAKNIAQGLGSAITGTDYQPTRRYFRDVVEQQGIHNGIAKFGLGVAGDVLLDPTTYFGGAIARGLIGGAKLATGAGLSAIEKASPEVAAGLKTAGSGLQDAAGALFKYGYKASPGATADVATFLSKEQQAKLGLAASNLARLGTGVLSKDQAEELALKLVAGKREEFVARQGAQLASEVTSADPVVQAAIDAQKARTAKFAGQLGLENPYETYFPFLKKDSMDKFISQISNSAIKVGSEGYRKEFKNLLTDAELELNPAKAFFTSEAQQVTDRMNRDFLNGFVQKYGKPITEFPSLEAAQKAGFDIIREKGIFGKDIGYVGKYDAKLIKDALDPGFQTINMVAKATGFDAITSLFKRAVTGIFPPFHVRNYVSGLIQNFEGLGLEALNPKNIAAGQKVAYLMGKGEKLSPELNKIFKPFVDRFSGDTFYNADFEEALKSGNALKSMEGLFSMNRLKTTVKTLGLGQEAIPFKLGRTIGQFIEHQQKATAYITALNQGKSVPEALALAEKVGFDYRALTAFESQIMRRLVPFYSFTRKNIGLQLATLGENPQRINQVLSFFNNMGDQLSEEEKKVLPSFLKESLGVKLQDTPEGLKQYISSFGTPIEAFAQLFGSNPILRGISQMNPLLKTPIEIGIGKDSFRQKDLQDVYDANEYKLAPKVVKDLLDITPVQKPILKKLPDGKLIKVGERTQYVADPVRLLIARSLFTSRGVSYLDQIFGGDMTGFTKALKLTTGLKPIQQDLEVDRSIMETNQKRSLEDLLTRKGGLNKFQTIYKPK